MRDEDLHFAVFDIVSEARAQVVADRLDHDLFCLRQRVDFLECVQLLALDLQHGLDAQNAADERGGGGEPSSLLEIFQGVECDINAAVKLRLDEVVRNLLRRLSLADKFERGVTEMR